MAIIIYLIIGFIVLITIVFFGILVMAIGFYNRAQDLKLRVDNANAQIAAAIKRIQTKIKNLEKAFEKTTDKESEIWKLFAEARKINPESPQDQEKFNKVIPQLFDKLNITFEQYPDLKAIPEIGKLFYEDINTMYEQYISGINVYNNAVYEYNLHIKTFPNNLFAKIFGFKEIKMFETSNLENIKKVENDEEKLSNMLE